MSKANKLDCFSERCSCFFDFAITPANSNNSSLLEWHFVIFNYSKVPKIITLCLGSDTLYPKCTFAQNERAAQRVDTFGPRRMCQTSLIGGSHIMYICTPWWTHVPHSLSPLTRHAVPLRSSKTKLCSVRMAPARRTLVLSTPTNSSPLRTPIFHQRIPQGPDVLPCPKQHSRAQLSRCHRIWHSVSPLLSDTTGAHYDIRSVAESCGCDTLSSSPWCGQNQEPTVLLRSKLTN